MASPLLAELEAQRARLYARLTAIGDFRRGSVSATYRRCGKPNCRRARSRVSRGHGPRWLWTTVPGRGTTRTASCRRARWTRSARSWRPYKEFAALSEQIVEVNEAICEARPVPGRLATAPDQEGQKRAPRSARRRLAAEAAAEIDAAGRRGGRPRWPAGAGWRRRSWRSAPR